MMWATGQMKFTAVPWGLGKLLGKRVNSIHTAPNYCMGADFTIKQIILMMIWNKHYFKDLKFKFR